MTETPWWADPERLAWLDLSPRQREKLRQLHGRQAVVTGVDPDSGEPVVYRDTVFIGSVEDELRRAEEREDDDDHAA